MRRYPRITGHIIAESLGYATPSVAAQVVADVHDGRLNYCEWIDACFRGDPRGAVRQAIRGRHYHRGFMADYSQARALVEQARSTGNEPLFASWF